MIAIKIETRRLLLRNFTEKDLGDVFEYCSQEGIGDMAGWPAHRSVSHTDKVLSGWIENKNQFAVVWKESGKVIGHISINEDSEEGRMDTRELGCALNRSYHRMGIMSEAIKCILDYLFEHNISFVWMCCFKENLPSRGMIEKCGFVFQKEGVFYSEILDKNFESYEYCISKNEIL